MNPPRKRSSFLLASAAALTALGGVGPGVSARVPFAWTPGQIEVGVHVNGTPATFLLDTGAEYSVVSTRLARGLGLRLEPSRGRDFANDIVLRIGNVSLDRQRVMVMPFDTYYKRGRTIDGLLGYDLFSRFVASIDLTERTISLWDPASFTPPAAAVTVPIEFEGRLSVVKSTLALSNGRAVPARLTIDTGASQAVILRYPFAQANRLLELTGDVEAKTTVAPSLASGDIRLVDVPVDHVSVSGLTFDHPRVQAHREPKGSGAYSDTDGLIGNALLFRFVVTVDYPHKRLLLQPARHRSPAAFAELPR